MELLQDLVVGSVGGLALRGLRRLVFGSPEDQLAAQVQALQEVARQQGETIAHLQGIVADQGPAALTWGPASNHQPRSRKRQAPQQDANDDTESLAAKRRRTEELWARFEAEHEQEELEDEAFAAAEQAEDNDSDEDPDSEGSSDESEEESDDCDEDETDESQEEEGQESDSEEDPYEGLEDAEKEDLSRSLPEGSNDSGAEQSASQPNSDTTSSEEEHGSQQDASPEDSFRTEASPSPPAEKETRDQAELADQDAAEMAERRFGGRRLSSSFISESDYSEPSTDGSELQPEGREHSTLYNFAGCQQGAASAENGQSLAAEADTAEDSPPLPGLVIPQVTEPSNADRLLHAQAGFKASQDKEVSKHKDALKPAAPISKKPHGIVGRVGGWLSALNPRRWALNEDQNHTLSSENDGQIMKDTGAGAANADLAPEARSPMSSALLAALEHPTQQNVQAAVKQAAGGRFLSPLELIERAHNGSAQVAAVARAGPNKASPLLQPAFHRTAAQPSLCYSFNREAAPRLRRARALLAGQQRPAASRALADWVEEMHGHHRRLRSEATAEPSADGIARGLARATLGDGFDPTGEDPDKEERPWWVCGGPHSYVRGDTTAKDDPTKEFGRGRSPSYSPRFYPDQVSEPLPPPHSPGTESPPREAESPQAASPTPLTPPYSLPERSSPPRNLATDALEPFRLYSTPSPPPPPPYNYDMPAHEMPWMASPQRSPPADSPFPSRPAGRPARFNLSQPSPSPQGFRREYQPAALRAGHSPAYSPSPASPLACISRPFNPCSPDFSPSSPAFKPSSPAFRPSSPLRSRDFSPASAAYRPSSLRDFNPTYSPPFSPTSPAWQPSAAPLYNPTRIPLHSSLGGEAREDGALPDICSARGRSVSRYEWPGLYLDCEGRGRSGSRRGARSSRSRSPRARDYSPRSGRTASRSLSRTASPARRVSPLPRSDLPFPGHLDLSYEDFRSGGTPRISSPSQSPDSRHRARWAGWRPFARSPARMVRSKPGTRRHSCSPGRSSSRSRTRSRSKRSAATSETSRSLGSRSASPLVRPDGRAATLSPSRAATLSPSPAPPGMHPLIAAQLGLRPPASPSPPPASPAPYASTIDVSPSPSVIEEAGEETRAAYQPSHRPVLPAGAEAPVPNWRLIRVEVAASAPKAPPPALPSRSCDTLADNQATSADGRSGSAAAGDGRPSSSRGDRRSRYHHHLKTRKWSKKALRIARRIKRQLCKRGPQGLTPVRANASLHPQAAPQQPPSTTPPQGSTQQAAQQRQGSPVPGQSMSASPKANSPQSPQTHKESLGPKPSSSEGPSAIDMLASATLKTVPKGRALAQDIAAQLRLPGLTQQDVGGIRDNMCRRLRQIAVEAGLGLGRKTGVFADEESAGEEQWPPPPPPPLPMTTGVFAESSSARARVATGVFADSASAGVGAGGSSPSSNGDVEIVSEGSSEDRKEALKCRRSAAPDMEVVDLCGE